MRSPHGLGAGRNSALSLSIACLALVLGAAPMLASHHLESEVGEVDDGGRSIRVALRTDTILVGGRIRADVYICGAGVTDVEECSFAKKAKVTVKPKGVLKPNKGQGAQVLFTGKKQGAATITATQKGLTGSAEIKVNKPPERNPAPAEEFRLYIEPEMKMALAGETWVATAWGCPMGADGRLGQNSVPDGIDDGCMTVDIDAVNIDPGTPVDLFGPQGASFGLRLGEFPPEVSGDVIFIPAQVVTSIGSTLPSFQGQRSRFEGLSVVDIDMDGDVDLDDYIELSGSFDPTAGPTLQDDPGFIPRLDLNHDTKLDSTDVGVFRMLAPQATPEDGANNGDATAADGSSQDAARAADTDSDFAQLLEGMDDGTLGTGTTELLADYIMSLNPGAPASGDLDGDGSLSETDRQIAIAIGNINKVARGEAESLGSERGPAIYDSAADMDGDQDVDDDDVDAIKALFAGSGAEEPSS